MTIPVELKPRLYFSYNQFLVYDASVQLPGCDWTPGHYAQGFARRESVACFRALQESGYGHVFVNRDPYRPSHKYERVVAVPFLVVSGKVVVDGPEETGLDRSFEVSQGEYRLVAAQGFARGEVIVDLFFETVSVGLGRSEILVADSELNPPQTLLESAKVAGLP